MFPLHILPYPLCPTHYLLYGMRVAALSPLYAARDVLLCRRMSSLFDRLIYARHSVFNFPVSPLLPDI